MEKRKVTNVMSTMLALTLVLAMNVVVASAEPGKLVHNAWNPPGVMLGITKNDISLKNEVKLCQPVPTDDTSKGVKWRFCNMDFTYSLQQLDKNSAQYFPFNDFPSGGNSGRISASEMMIVVVDILDNDPATDGYIQYSWFKKGANVDKLLFQSQRIIVPPCGGYPPIGNGRECGIYKTYENYAYIGHFSREIDEGGYYYVIVDTKWGQAIVDFGVVPVPNGGAGDGVRIVVTPVPKVTQVQTTATPVVTPVVTSASNSFSYNTGEWVGSGLQSFLSGMAHGFWNGVFG